MAKGKKGKQHKASNTTSQHSSLASIDAKAFEDELVTAAEQRTTGRLKILSVQKSASLPSHWPRANQCRTLPPSRPR
ncbi:UNVERIFIED_CONTAM: hypothetical protein Sangu_0538200 [Sesamum angustifolium]|uniref:Uncharacterized protein n=1 Tax=Sesamum angustifolium TaxID=2727405 RepID=A0AAW2Q9K4_9LAMI